MKQIQIIGNLGSDAEVKKFNDKEYISLSVGVSEKVNNEPVTTWFACLKYGASEALIQYLKKGTKVFIQGNLNAKLSESNGKTYLNLNVNVDKLELIGNKTEVTTTTPPETTYSTPSELNPKGSDLPF